MSSKVRGSDTAAAAKRIRSESDLPLGRDRRVRRSSGRADALSPSIGAEIAAAIETLIDKEKIDDAAKLVGVGRSLCYELIDHPLDVTVAELLRLIAHCPDKQFGSRLRGHLAALDAYKSIAEAEARETWARLTTGQRSLFGDKR